MASVERRGDVWRVVVRLPGGKKISATRDTKAEAEVWGATQERLKSLGKLTATSEVLVDELFDSFETDLASKTDSGRWNSLRIRKWSDDPIVKLRVSAVTTHDINGWIERRGKSVSPATVNRELNLMSAAFTYAVKVRRWIETNPCHGARRPERTRPRKRALLTPHEIAAICTATGYDSDPKLRTLSARVGACFLLALETGMRSGEMLRARPRDYWPDKRTLHVAATEVGGRKSSRSGTSSADPSRNVPLTERAMTLIQQLLDSKPPGQPYIVGLTDRQRDALWRKAVKLSGVDDLHFHDSKHEAATRLAPLLDVLALSHALGTKDVRLLRDTYYDNDASVSAARLPLQLTPV